MNAPPFTSDTDARGQELTGNVEPDSPAVGFRRHQPGQAPVIAPSGSPSEESLTDLQHRFGPRRGQELFDRRERKKLLVGKNKGVVEAVKAASEAETADSLAAEEVLFRLESDVARAADQIECAGERLVIFRDQVVTIEHSLTFGWGDRSFDTKLLTYAFLRNAKDACADYDRVKKALDERLKVAQKALADYSAALK